ncbi:hypothetical protein TOL_2041 [Thalassolituus oleivorans MIL-1]|uniref:Uncharacterized protein n=1 Tax=Thalassolituus oleivorans MIL-1 TaxID=1298593 RepID=M5DRA7_9GAMM|nr:hypothetical protein TOL_2041 [Thalassolituus oleivorans MIL-1]
MDIDLIPYGLMSFNKSSDVSSLEGNPNWSNKQLSV